MSESENYLFDRFCLSTRPGVNGVSEIKLYFDGSPQILTSHESKTLGILVKKRGEFIDTKTLADEVCGHSSQADENTIHVAIRGLRRIFRDPVKGGKFIKNERSRGYCFLAEVRRVRDEELDEVIRTQAEGRVAEAARQVDETTPLRAGGEEADAARPVVANVTPEDLKDQVISFRELWLSAGKLMRWVIRLGVVATMAVSVAVIIRGWQNVTLYVSIPQLFMLLFALAYVLPGPRGLHEDFRKAAGFDDPREGDDARHIAEKALGRYTIYWRGILATWLLLYFCLGFIEPGNTATSRNQIVGILTTLFNNISTAMFVLCYNVLNQPVEIKPGKREMSDTPWLLWSIVLVVAFLLVEIFTWRSFAPERATLLYVFSLISGIVGGIGMALYVGRLQSKFLGPSPWLVLALYSYTAIQPLFIFLVSVPEGKQVFDEPTVTLIAVILVNIALILKCLLYLYVALLFQSGSLLFYFVKVRRTYLNVDRERREFRKFLKRES